MIEDPTKPLLSLELKQILQRLEKRKEDDLFLAQDPKSTLGYKSVGCGHLFTPSVLSAFQLFSVFNPTLFYFSRMHAFSRLTSFILFVLSLSIFAHALPAPGTAGALTTRDSKCDSLANVLVDLKVKVDACVSALVKADALVDATAQLDLIVGHVETCAHDIVSIGQATEVDAVVKADIAAKVAAIIAVIVKACLKLTVKFGIQVLLELFAKIDAALKLLLVNVGACIDGIVLSISKIVLATCAHIIVTLDFKLCAEVLAFVGL